jgi:hypothetical protein
MSYQLPPGLAGLTQGADANLLRGEDGRMVMLDQNMPGHHAMLLQLQNMQNGQMGLQLQNMQNGQMGHAEASQAAGAGLPGGFFILQEGANHGNSLAR